MRQSRDKEIRFRPVGLVHSGFREREGTPRQAVGATGSRGRIEIDPALAEGLADLDGFSHVLVVFHLDRVGEAHLTAHPPWDDRPHGVFATCSPNRPNPIGVSVVRLERVEGTVLHISELDMLDGTPVLDVKPYVPRLFPRDGVRIGWLDGRVDGMTGSKTGDR